MDTGFADLFLPLDKPKDGWQISSVPYDYQERDRNETFRLWDESVPGAMTRIFTGGGKTYATCNKARTWLNRGPSITRSNGSSTSSSSLGAAANTFAFLYSSQSDSSFVRAAMNADTFSRSHFRHAFWPSST